MGKRSDFQRIERDFYPTPQAAVQPLIPHLPSSGTFAEPCAGNGALIDHIEEGSGLICKIATDISPQRSDIGPGDALEQRFDDIDIIITNPPWDRKILHPMIEFFSDQAPTWLLFDADWAHTKQSAELMKRCIAIVSIGRVKWFPDSKMTGKDNCAWYLFERGFIGATQFHGRGEYNDKYYRRAS